MHLRQKKEEEEKQSPPPSTKKPIGCDDRPPIRVKLAVVAMLVQYLQSVSVSSSVAQVGNSSKSTAIVV